MMFSSKTPRDLNRDPEPWRIWIGPWVNTRVGSPIAGMTEHDPRPEFDHPQHNEPNPILVTFREEEEARNPYALRQWLSFFDPSEYFPHGWDGSICLATPAHVDHARRVLTRLATMEA